MHELDEADGQGQVLVLVDGLVDDEVLHVVLQQRGLGVTGLLHELQLRLHDFDVRLDDLITALVPAKHGHRLLRSVLVVSVVLLVVETPLLLDHLAQQVTAAFVGELSLDALTEFLLLL